MQRLSAYSPNTLHRLPAQCTSYTMAFHSQKEIYDFNTPSDSSNRKSTDRTQYRRCSIESIKSFPGSISNSSVHNTTSTAATREDLFDFSEHGPGGFPSTSHCKSFHSLEKPTLPLRNESIHTIYEAGSVHSSTVTSTWQEIRSLKIPSFEDEDESPLSPTPRSSAHNLSTLLEPRPHPGFVPSERTKTLAQTIVPPTVESSLHSTRTVPTSSSSFNTEDYPMTGRVRALHTFEPTEPNDLGFKKGDVIMVLNREFKDWWRGQLRGRTGYFPANYVVCFAHLYPASASAYVLMVLRNLVQSPIWPSWRSRKPLCSHKRPMSIGC